MDDVARLPVADRIDLFSASASRRGWSVEIIEKDFWVCWTLKLLFTLSRLSAGLLFKGGTSLSKVFRIIERFSEDVDLSFDRAGLGFEGDSDPLRVQGTKKRQRLLKEIGRACQHEIVGQLLPRMRDRLDAELGNSPQSGWGLELDPEDPDGQTLLFHYPSGIPARSATRSSYIPAIVRIEFGARSDHWPAVNATVQPYAAEDFPEPFTSPVCNVHVLAPERTFWEKATILHKWHHTPASKPFKDRQSRHYNDLVRMYQHTSTQAAIKDVELLAKVARHKEVFFAEKSARYPDARPGSLRLVPTDDRLQELEGDCRKMGEMIFGNQPTFQDLLAVLRDMEIQINGR